MQKPTLGTAPAFLLCVWFLAENRKPAPSWRKGDVRFMTASQLYVPSTHWGESSWETQWKKYQQQKYSCGSQKQRHTVREWLGRFNIPENDEFFLLWTKVVSALSIPFRELRQKGIAEEPLNTLWNIVYHELYLNYNLRKDFMPQFQASSERLIKLSQLAKELLVHLDTQPRLEV